MAVAATATDLTGERRLVTVLFADIVGFTALAETLDPEELQELMAGIFQSLVEEAVKADGTIEKFIGDAIFVVFGAPLAHEDDAQRALRTATQMQRAFAEHAAVVRSRYGRELGLRIGVHTGIVVAGHVRSTAEYGVMGDTVNIAARLQQSAQAGEVLVTQATFRLTNQRFAFREVGPIEVKGKERPVLTYALTSEREVARPTIELNAPLVGRWMELSRLDLAYQSSLVGRAEFAAISGEPGIGKSRLVNEFLGLLEAPREGRDSAPLVLRWTYGGVGGSSYAGFVETLYEAFGIERIASDAGERLDARIHELKPPDHTGVLAELTVFLGLRPAPPETTDHEEVRRRRYRAVREAYAALARERPLVLVLEDLHHADTASVDLLADLLARPIRARLLWLLTYRAMPEGLTHIAPRANFTSLVLDPLTVEEAARVVEAVLEWVPDALRDRIVERAGGNPFFIEETIRALIESGAIVRDGEGWRLERAPAQLEVPATLHALVASRIDRLPPLARECLQVASVIGTRFAHRVLSAAAGPEVAAAVEQLIDADLVVYAGPAGTRLGRHRFKHAITQEVAYQTLLLRRRTELHRRVAEAIERVYADDLRDLYAVLAHHYALAEVSDRAADYAWKAANAALEIHAHGEALRHAEQAAGLFERAHADDDAVRALMAVGLVQRYRGEPDAAVTAYQRALGIAERADPQGPRVRELYGAIAETCTRWGAHLPDLEGFIERGLALVGTAPTRERALLLAARAFSVRRRPQPTEADLENALATAREALAIAEQVGVLREVSLCLDAVGYAQRELGRFADALETHLRRIPIAQTLQDSDELIDAHTMVAQCVQVVGSLADAADHARQARELATATGKELLRAAATAQEAQAHLFASDFPGALDLARELLASGEPRRPTASALALGVAAAAALGDPAERELREAVLAAADPAAATLARLDVLAAFYGMRRGETSYAAAREAGPISDAVARILLLPLLRLAAARWGLEDPALEEQARTLIERSGNARGRALLAHARALASDEPEPVYAEALAAYEQLGLLFEQALCLYDLARHRARMGAPASEVAPLLERARALAEQLGARPLLAALSDSR